MRLKASTETKASLTTDIHDSGGVLMLSAIKLFILFYSIFEGLAKMPALSNICPLFGLAPQFLIRQGRESHDQISIC